MGKCTYCSEDAGFLRKVHQTCTKKNEAGWSKMVAMATSVAINDDAGDTLVAKLSCIASDSYIPAVRIREAIIQGWSNAVDQYLDDHVLSDLEETRLIKYIDRFSLSREEKDRDRSFTHMVQGAVIRDVLNGNLPSRVNIQGTLPFNLQKSESIVWVFQNVAYYETRMRRERVGGYSGVSMRVMKGVYYHTGGFKSHSVEKTATEYVDTGIVGVTNKHIYFNGAVKKFRVPYAKIVMFEPYDDGIGIMRDAASAKPQTFVTGDGWFVYNLVNNLAQGRLLPA
jgi:hypothetical protein